MPAICLARLPVAGRRCAHSFKIDAGCFPSMSCPIRPVHLKRTAQSFRQEMVSKATVVDISQESPTVKRLALQPSDDKFMFRAGQWVDVFIPGIDIVGGFSMCSCPKLLNSTGTFELAVKATPHPPARWISEECKSGDVVEVRVGGDFHFPPALYHSSLPQAAVVCHGVPTSIGQEESNDGSRPLPSTVADCDVLLIGGGVGINPLYSVLTEVTTPSPTVSSRDAASHCEPSGTPSPSRGIAGSSVHVQSVTLLHSTQALDELLFRDSLERLGNNQESHCNLQMHVCVTRENPPAANTTDARPRLAYHGGRITRQLLSQCVDQLRKPNLLCYICGPPNMIEWVVDELRRLHVPDDQIHYEKWW